MTDRSQVKAIRVIPISPVSPVTERSPAIEIRDHRIELCQGCVVVTFLESLPCRDELGAKLATQFVIALLGVPEHRSAPDSSAIF